MSLLLRSAVMLGTLVVLPANAGAQSTRPKGAPREGLALTDEQIQAKLDALNRKAASQPAADARSDADDLAYRRAKYVESQLRQADQHARVYQNAQASTAAAREALAKAWPELEQVQRDGQVAEQQLNDILCRFDALSALAAASGRSSFTAHTSGSIAADRVGLTTYGTIYDPSQSLTAIMAVEGQYGPELKQARIRVAELYDRYRQLLTDIQRAQYSLTNDSKLGAAALSRYKQAMKNAGHAGATLPGLQQAANDSAWNEAEKQYPGVDVRAVWRDALQEATAVIGADNPKLNDLAGKFFHERAAEASRLAAVPAGQRGSTPTTVPSDVPTDLVPVDCK